MLKRIAVFVSGGGSNLQSLIDGVNSGEIKAEMAAVIASSSKIFAVERAKIHNIPCFVMRKRDFSSLDAMYDEIIAILKERNVDLVVLAGYLTILTPNIIEAFRGRIINIHPSLIPKYCGMGFYGLKVHEAVVAAGEKESGATVHFVDEGADTGKIIRQERVPVYPSDTAETLAARVLEVEHRILRETVKQLVEADLPSKSEVCK
ncbi:MAG TPA: phosphoribosylglycinamide formyltransferase [Eubacteriales bacterium]|nr:phosphoribosylglycinamide formyltransferase [Clostridia bacterium]HRR89183.1 phosphoribosylglycinamide formyltransferase [Eubacteriales bacterium]HRU83819.1 phosphoribosylglycinamide formyltransferase [Eubacteriales bacterium]